MRFIQFRLRYQLLQTGILVLQPFQTLCLNDPDYNIFRLIDSRWVRSVSCRVAAHETDSLYDCVVLG